MRHNKVAHTKLLELLLYLCKVRSRLDLKITIVISSEICLDHPADTAVLAAPSRQCLLDCVPRDVEARADIEACLDVEARLDVATCADVGARASNVIKGMRKSCEKEVHKSIRIRLKLRTCSEVVEEIVR